MKTALIQMRTVLDKAQNVADAVAQIAAAAQQGADLAVLPEMFCCPYQHKYFRPYSEPAGGPVWQALSDAARTNHIWVVGGTFPELDGEKPEEIRAACEAAPAEQNPQEAAKEEEHEH